MQFRTVTPMRTLPVTASAPRLAALCLSVIACLPSVAAERTPWTASKIQGSPEPPSPFVTERVFTNLTFSNPIDITALPASKRLVVAEQNGRLYSFDSDATSGQPELFADLTAYDPEIAQSYAFTFHPRFLENRYVFIWANLDLKGEKTRENGTRILRFKVTGGPVPRIDPGSGTTIFSWTAGGHNGGNVRFGPDGMLYIATGDAAPPDPPDPFATGQDISDVLSSVLRIDVDHPEDGRAYAIPKDNPFLKEPKARGEVWAYGLRNPWRMSFDPKSGDLFVGDVGWELWEMIYRIKPGGNYGWSLTEGGRQEVLPNRLRGPSPVLPPLVAHSHEEAASITGGEFYHGSRLPSLNGCYLYGDWQTGTFWRIKTDGDRVLEHRELCRSSLMPVAFGKDAAGEILICDHLGGGIWRLIENPNAGKQSPFPRKLSQTGLFSNTTTQTPAPGVVPYSINAPRWADHATSERWAAFPDGGAVTISEVSKGVLQRGQWRFPKGAVLAKTYSLAMNRSKPDVKRRVETQVLHYDGSLWGTYSYRWNAEQTDADLVPSRGDDASFAVKDPTVPGGETEETWRFFSRSECGRCHSMWTNFTPGFNTLQLDRVTDTAPGRQTDLLAKIGLIPEEPRLADPLGKVGTPELRARSYLHANCSTCHRQNGGGAVPVYLNIDISAKDMKVFNVRPVQGDLGLPDGRLVARGDAARSVLLYRMATGGRGHMPYLGGHLVDDRGLIVVRDWINGMKEDPGDSAPETRTLRAKERSDLQKLKSGDSGQLDSLLASNSGALDLLLAIVDGSLPSSIRSDAVARGAALTDPVRRDLFERFLPESQRRKVLGTGFNPDTVLRRTGNAGSGKALFAGLCAACHQVNGTGMDFGPALDHIGSKWDREALLEQIIYPTKWIEPQWQTTTLELEGGGSKTGFQVSKTAVSTVLKLAGGTTETIPTYKVINTALSKISAMPEGLLQGLTAQEAADLLQYLGTLK